MNRTQDPCKTGENHAPTFRKTMGGNVANADETNPVPSLTSRHLIICSRADNPMNHDNDANTVEMQLNYRIERSSDAGPNYKLVSMKGCVVARFNWLNVGGIRTAMGDGSVELSPSKVTLVNRNEDTPAASDNETTYAAGAKVMEVEE